jgi:hypothetical protein
VVAVAPVDVEDGAERDVEESDGGAIALGLATPFPFPFVGPAAYPSFPSPEPLELAGKGLVYEFAWWVMEVVDPLRASSAILGAVGRFMPFSPLPAPGADVLERAPPDAGDVVFALEGAGEGNGFHSSVTL